MPRIGFRREFIKNSLFLNSDLYAVDAAGSNASLRWGLGVEYVNPAWFSWRLGVCQKQASAGFGISSRRVDFDYAFIYHPLDFIHMITLTFRYGFLPSREELLIDEKRQEFQKEKEEYLKEKIFQEEKMRAETKKIRLEQELSIKFIKARQEFDDKNFQESKRIAQEILYADPDHANAKGLLAEIDSRLEKSAVTKRLADAQKSYKQGKYENAMIDVNFVLGIYSDEPNALLLKRMINAHLLMNQMKFQEAKNELIEVLKMDPANEEATRLLKRLQTILGL
jgi:tetratricopeptide (TPR) repeat protein